jgi:hypothetical protein
MVGICGSWGEEPVDVSAIFSYLTNPGDHQSDFIDSSLSVSVGTHDPFLQPAETNEGDVLLWAWGDIYSHETQDGYRAK